MGEDLGGGGRQIHGYLELCGPLTQSLQKHVVTSLPLTNGTEI